MSVISKKPDAKHLWFARLSAQTTKDRTVTLPFGEAKDGVVPTATFLLPKDIVDDVFFEPTIITVHNSILSTWSVLKPALLK